MDGNVFMENGLSLTLGFILLFDALLSSFVLLFDALHFDS